MDRSEIAASELETETCDGGGQKKCFGRCRSVSNKRTSVVTLQRFFAAELSESRWIKTPTTTNRANPSVAALLFTNYYNTMWNMRELMLISSVIFMIQNAWVKAEAVECLITEECLMKAPFVALNAIRADRMTVSWTPPSKSINSGLYLEVKRLLDSNEEAEEEDWKVNQEVNLASSSSSTAARLNVTNLLPFTRYRFRVSAPDKNLTSNPSVAYRTLASGPPSPPFIESVFEVNAVRLNVTWKEPSIRGARLAFYRLSIDNGRGKILQKDVEPDAKSYLTASLDYDTLYNISLTAFNRLELHSKLIT